MPYENQNPGATNDQNAFAVNSNSIAMFSADGTMLRFSFKNDRLILTIIPRVEDPAGGRPRWPRELGKSAILQPVQASALYNLFMEKMSQEIIEGKDHDGYLAVGLNRDFTSLVGIGWKNGNGELIICQNVNADRTCSTVSRYPFQKQMAIDNYDPTSGQYTVKEIDAQFLLFVETLRAFNGAVGGSDAHMVKNLTNYNFNQIMNHLKALALKMGVTVQNTPMYQYGNHGGATGGAFASGGNESVTYTTGYQENAMSNQTAIPEVDTSANLSDLLGGDGSPF